MYAQQTLAQLFGCSRQLTKSAFRCHCVLVSTRRDICSSSWQGTPFEGGTFVINIDIPTGYPFEPPKMKFITKIWHPNISSQTGAICLVSFFFSLYF